MALSAVCFSALATPSDPAFDKARIRYAQSSARDLMSNLVAQRASGTSWKLVLGQTLPKQIDDRCGYREKLNLPEDGFNEMRDAVIPVLGARLDTNFSPLLSRPSARLALVDVRPLKSSGVDQVMVVTRVEPAKPGDITLGFLYQLDQGGRMALCDVIAGSKPDQGMLYNLGRELDR
jgi:hypothetical protein